MRNERTYLHCIVLYFTIGTGGTYFYFVLYVTGTGKMYFVSWLINFVRGWRFLSSTPPAIGTYSIEVELGCYVNCCCCFFLGVVCYAAYYLWCTPYFFLGRYVMCLVCVWCVISEAMLLTPDTHSMECPFNAF